ncbi:MAG: hypothetical protein IPM82_25515 [Saprospiraceae bacterium]|nr:hypothetical protein [Saprospiraceae bacterium]
MTSKPTWTGNKRKYAGVWRKARMATTLGGRMANFEAKWKELAKQNLRLIDIETYEEGGKRKYTGVWRAGSGGHYLWAGVDWENFTSKWAECAQNKLRLVDLETYESSCEKKCLNTALMPDNPETPSRDGWATITIFWVPTSIARELSSTCASNTDDVVYRWPNVKYGDTYYLRLSAIYDANDKIFTLPFKDKVGDMSKNGWRYSTGDWHHALDYSCRTAKTFQVRFRSAGQGCVFWLGQLVGRHDGRQPRCGQAKDVYRTIYMHLRNGADNDRESA